MGRRETRTQEALVAALRARLKDAVSRRPVRSGGQGFVFQQPSKPVQTGTGTLGYTRSLMAEKINGSVVTAAQYQEQLAEYREKLGWVREYL